MADAFVELAPGAYRIPLSPLDFINAFAFVHDDGQVTLVDTGVPQSSPRIMAGLEAIGSHAMNVTRIVLTHAHPDHVGSIGPTRRALPVEDIAAHEVDAPWIEQGTPPKRDERTVLGRYLNRQIDSGSTAWEPVPVTERLVDGQLIDGTGLRVHHTPGHTLGHIALVHEPTGVLITGDSIFHLPWGIQWSIPLFCIDVPLNKRTADVLGELDYEVAAFTHGTEVRDNAREQVRGFLRRKAQRAGR